MGSPPTVYGVMTGPASLCHWKVDPEGLSLWADIRCGGMGVQLERAVSRSAPWSARKGRPGESAFQAAKAFCRMLCPKPRLPKESVYGFNDWYCVYGDSTAEGVVEDARFMASLAPADECAALHVVDDGWQADPKEGPRPWDRGNAKFPIDAGSGEEHPQDGMSSGHLYRPLAAAERTIHSPGD